MLICAGKWNAGKAVGIKKESLNRLRNSNGIYFSKSGIVFLETRLSIQYLHIHTIQQMMMDPFLCFAFNIAQRKLWVVHQFSHECSLIYEKSWAYRKIVKYLHSWFPTSCARVHKSWKERKQKKRDEMSARRLTWFVSVCAEVLLNYWRLYSSWSYYSFFLRLYTWIIA